jgi:hypothetical protein
VLETEKLNSLGSYLVMAIHAVTSLIGLNLSRSWMLKRIVAKLSKSDTRKSLLLNAAAAHANEGHKAVTLDHFASSHWLASFALLDLTDECSY